MKPTRWRLLLLAAALVMSGLMTSVNIAVAQGCGPVGPNPPNPPGCKDLTPICTCDSNGGNCKYTWQCVPIG